MSKHIYFHPLWSTDKIPVNSREEILNIIQERQTGISGIEIVFQDGKYWVLATTHTDWKYFGLGTVTDEI